MSPVITHKEQPPSADEICSYPCSKDDACDGQPIASSSSTPTSWRRGSIGHQRGSDELLAPYSGSQTPSNASLETLVAQPTLPLLSAAVEAETHAVSAIIAQAPSPLAPLSYLRRGSSTTSSSESVSSVVSSLEDHGRGRAHVGAVYSVFAAFGVTYASGQARLAGLKQSHHASVGEMSTLLLATTIGAILGAQTSASLNRGLGPSRTFALAAILFPLTWAATFGARAWALTEVMAGLSGIFSGLYDNGINVAASVAEAHGSHGVIGTAHGLCGIGAFAGALLGQLSEAKHISLGAFMGAVGVCTALVGAWAQRSMRFESQAASTSTSTGTPVPRYNLTVQTLGILAGLSSLGEGAMSDWSAVYLHDILGIPLERSSRGFVAYTLSLTAGRLGMRYLPRQGAATLMGAGGALVAVSLGWALRSDNEHVFVAGAAGAGLGLSTFSPLVIQQVGQLFPDQRSEAMGIVASYQNVGFLSGPVLIGALSHAVGLRQALMVVPAIGALKCLVSPALSRLLKRPAPSAALL